jgi:hypothetical protein
MLFRCLFRDRYPVYTLQYYNMFRPSLAIVGQYICGVTFLLYCCFSLQNAMAQKQQLTIQYPNNFGVQYIGDPN